MPGSGCLLPGVSVSELLSLRWIGAVRTLAVLGVLAAVTGCGSSTATPKGSNANKQPAQSSGTEATSTKNVKPSDLCTVITAADAAALFGESAEPTPSSGAEKLVSGLCLYRHRGDDLTVRNLLQVRTYPGAQFYGERLFPKRTGVSALGTKAFEDVNTTAHKVVIQFVKHGSTGIIDYSTGAGVDVRTRSAGVRTLAKKLAASL